MKKVKCIDVYQCDWCPRVVDDEDVFPYILTYRKEEGSFGPFHFCSTSCFLAWVDRVIKRVT